MPARASRRYEKALSLWGRAGDGFCVVLFNAVALASGNDAAADCEQDNQAFQDAFNGGRRPEYQAERRTTGILAAEVMLKEAFFYDVIFVCTAARTFRDGG